MAQKPVRRRAGCLLLILSPFALLFLVYQAAYYNPMRLSNRNHLAKALKGGLIAECDRFIASTNTDSYRPARSEWPPAIRGLHPRGVFVYPRQPDQVYIELWKNYREWERNSLLGLWTEKGACGVSLIVYANGPDEAEIDRRNADSLVPNFTRRVDERIYLQYPKRMEQTVAMHTDLFRRDETSSAHRSDK